MRHARASLLIASVAALGFGFLGTAEAGFAAHNFAIDQRMKVFFGADVSVGTPGDDEVLTYDAATGTWGSEAAAGGGGGFTIGLPVSAGVASISSTTFPGFTTTATSGLPALAYDGAQQEAAQWTLTLPAAYDSASALTVEAVIHSGSTSQAVRFGVRIGSVEAADVTTAPGTILDTQQVVDATTSGTIDTTTTITWSIATGDMDSAAAGDLILLQLDRDAASAEDSSTVDVFVAELRCYQ